MPSIALEASCSKTQSREQQSPEAESLLGKVDIFKIEKDDFDSLPSFVHHFTYKTQAIIAKAKIGEEVGGRLSTR